MSLVCGNPKCGKPCQDWICFDCERKIVAALGRIPWLVEQLEITVTRQDKLSAGKLAGKSTETPSVFHGGASAFLRDLRGTLARTVQEICEARGMRYLPLWATHEPTFIGPLRGGERRPSHGYVASTTDLAKWLKYYSGAIRTSECAGETFGDITRIVDRGLALINRPEPPIYRGPCPTVRNHDERGKPVACGHSLYAERGADFAKCPRCKVEHDIARLEAKLLADMSAYLFTATQLFQVLRELGEPIPKSTFYLWRKLGKIQPRGWMHDGRRTDHFIHRNDAPLFSLEDARRLRAKDDQSTNSEKVAK